MSHAGDSATPTTDEEPERPRWKKRGIQLAPYVITGGIVAMLLNEYSPEQIALEMGRGDVRWLLPIAFGQLIISLLLVSFADKVVIQGAGFTRASYFDVLRAKASSSLLDIVGYAAGHGGYAVWIARHAGGGEQKRGLRAAGAMMYIVASDLFAVCMIATVSIYGLGADVPGAIAWVAPCIAGLLVLFVITGKHGPLSERFELFKAWRFVPRGLGLMQMGIRTLQISMIIMGTWIGATSFGLDIPVGAMLAYFPVVMLVASLPINVAGFGAVQGAWLLFLPFEPAPKILAFQVLWGLAVVVGIFVRGFVFVKRVVREAAE